MACEKFWIEKLWEFFSQQRRQVSPQGSIHLSRELGIYAYCLLPSWPKSSPYMCEAQLFSLFKANFQASILLVMSWLRGLLRCPTCLEVASTCFRDTRSVINQAGFLPCFPQDSPVDFVILIFQIICKNISLPDRPLCRRPAHPDDPEYLQKMSYQRQP